MGDRPGDDVSVPEKHSRLTDDGRAFWWTERLWRLASELPVQLVEIADIADFDRDCWFGGRPATCRAVADHARLIDSADLNYPVILAADGHLMDGGHRIAKAWLQGATRVSAVRFVETPEPDWIEAPAEHSGRLVVICGLPGSGKTTLGRRLEVEHGAIRLCPDEWMAAQDVDVFDERARTLVEQLQWQLAQRLLQLGQLVVIEWGAWARDERDALREGARALGAAVELRFLDQPDDVLWDRVRARDAEPPGGRRPLTRAELESYAASFQRPDPDELSLYDSPIL
jgi:predicted kinase